MKLLVILSLALFLAACKETSPPPAAAVDPLVVVPPPPLAAQLKPVAVALAPVADVLRVAGRIDFDEQRVTRIGATVTGRVTDLHAALGDTVQAGTVLAQLHSTELGTAQLGWLKARAHTDLMARAVDRARQLLAADVIGSAELQKRENELAIAQAEQRAAADQLRVLGVSAATLEKTAASGGINSTSAVVAPLAGIVVERKVTKGQVVQPADALFTVADLSRVWVVAQVPEGEASLVKAGQTVEVEVPALGNEKRSGTLIYVGDTVNPETRTVMVRTELDNRARELKPAMLATMLIRGRPTPRPVIPAEAVVRENNEDHVFVAVGDGRYRLTAVKLGPEFEGRRVVLSGLREGETVVAGGAFHLNNERKRKELEGG